jgi:hypothetical protein
MRAHRQLTVSTLAAALLLAAPVGAAASAPAAVRVVHCDPEAATGLPAGEYQGRMSAVTGTYRMSMRFDLQEKVGEAPWRTVHAGALKAWRRSHAGVRSFSYLQRVENMHAESSYRVLVHFRWLDAAGRTIRSSDRGSGVCAATAPVEVIPAV